MIAAYTIIAMLCFAAGWRGVTVNDLWRSMRVKWLALATIMALVALAMTGSVAGGALAAPIYYIFAALVGGASFLLGSVLRFIVKRVP